MWVAWVWHNFFARNKNFAFHRITWVRSDSRGSLTPNSYVIYPDWFISLVVDRIYLYSDPRLSCFTLHEITKNSDGSKEEILVGQFNIMPKGILKLGVEGTTQSQTQNQNEVAYLRNQTFSPCSWRPFYLHANRNVKPVQRLKWNLVTVFDYQRGFLVWEIQALLRGHQMPQRKYPLDTRKSFSLWAWKYTEAVVQAFLRDFQDLAEPDPDVLDLTLKHNLLWLDW